jgi:hypothetical protein
LLAVAAIPLGKLRVEILDLIQNYCGMKIPRPPTH